MSEMAKDTGHTAVVTMEGK